MTPARPVPLLTGRRLGESLGDGRDVQQLGSSRTPNRLRVSTHVHNLVRGRPEGAARCTLARSTEFAYCQ